MNVLKASSQWIRGTHTTDTTSIDFITITIIYKNNYKHISNRLWSRVCLHARTHTIVDVKWVVRGLPLRAASLS